MFYVVAAEEYTSYADEDEASTVFSDMSSILRDHQPPPIPKEFDKKDPH